jgi:hypothetical protein
MKFYSKLGWYLLYFYDLNCETIIVFFFCIIYKGRYAIHEPTNSKFDNNMDILWSMILIKYFLGGLKMVVDEPIKVDS